MSKYKINRALNKTVLLIAFIAINSLLFSTGQWIVPEDGGSGDLFGCSIDISGEYIVVGSKLDDIDNHINAGSANIFFNNGNEWIFDQKITAMIENNYDQFGYDVKINNDYLIVGTPYCDHDDKTDAGSAYIFKRNASNNWEQQEHLTYYLQQHDEHFGKAVAISDDYAIIGAPENNYNYNPDYYDHGRVYFFQRSGNDWVFTTCGYAEDLLPNDHFGRDISLSGSYAVITAESGAYIFKHVNSWSRQTNLISGPVVAASISGNYVVLSTGDHDVYVFERDQDTDTWSQVAELSTNEGSQGFGTHGVSIKGNEIYIGSLYETFYYQKPSSGWTDMNEDCKISLSQGVSSVSINNMLTFTGSTSYGTAGGVYIEELVQNIVSGNVSLNGGEGDIEDVLITFDPISGSNIEVIPNSDGSFSHAFWADDFGTYDVTYKLFSADADYYPITIEDVVIDGTTAPLTLNDVTLHPITDPTNINVSCNENIPAFRNIQDCVDYIMFKEIDSSVHIFPGIYDESVSWDTDISHIKMSGVEMETCIIEGDHSFIFTVIGTDCNENDIIENLTIRNGSTAIANVGGISIIRNNKFENCDLAIVNCSPIKLQNNMFVNNQRCLWSFQFENLSTDYSVIENNVFMQNTSTQPLLYIDEMGYIDIRNNTFLDNTFDLDNDHTGSVIEFHTTSDSRSVYIEGNIFQNNNDVSSTGGSILSIDNNDPPNDINLSNNTFIENSAVAMINYSTVQTPKTNYNSIFKSNTIYGNNVINGEWLHCDYSLFYDNNANNGNCVFGDIIIEEDPLLDENNKPLWNSTSKSPCIDIGNGLNDPDGTPSDIGAVRAINHKIETIELIDATEGINWKCFPVLDDIYAEEDIAANVLYDIMLEPQPALEYVETQGGENNIYFLDPYWVNDDQEFTSVKGYKLTMNEAATLEITGFLEYSEQTINLVAGGENWLGYFLEGSMNPFDALAAVLDKINRITIRTGTYIKREDNTWLGVNNAPKKPTFNYGDLVIVNCTENGSFFWGEEGGGTVPKLTRPTAQDFAYTEEADYIPVYVELDLEALDNPTEIGIFVENECKGAEVLEDTLVQIRAYVFNDSLIFDPGTVEFQLSYGSRAENVLIDSYTLKEDLDDAGRIGKLDFSETQNSYYLISLSEPENNVPEIIKTSLDQNYPNPFNPSTTIAYSIQNDGMIELNVYNIKGQLVKTLVRGEQQAGSYEAVWNGKNNNEKGVSSGIYFYKLSTKDETIMKKMLMLK